MLRILSNLTVGALDSLLSEPAEVGHVEHTSDVLQRKHFFAWLWERTRSILIDLEIAELDVKQKF